ncbi:unnamed protein product, partial [Aphanomyces euteiches]
MADGRESDEPQLDESDGMECATPAVERPTGDGRDEERRKKKEEAVLGILMSKVADAQARGLTAEEAARLAALEANGMVYKNNRATWAAAP